MARTSQLRIVGGRYRGRRLPVPAHPGLRPTGDRTRETLFNWLAPVVAGARCLDAFAGSGALGLEAASRGAGEVVMLERAGQVVRQLQANVRTLGATEIQVRQADALRWLAAAADAPFDIVFLDPPFADGLLDPAIRLLVQHGWVAPGARVYLEAPARSEFAALPANWELARDKTAGQVRYGLAVVAEAPSSAVGDSAPD
ncbi:16S rRNA (guanine(966)-N(2))-methyltransferase RsmD [Thiorhodococcus minor]|uniref:16S rRNA (guanine(966)-N(2))-methyltransferase RsmD n=1 Tax=Thiorhodococcus minor TaxID=57489 RepID=UPI0031582E97